MKKTYHCDYNMQYRVTIEIDHSILTEEALKELVSFWGEESFWQNINHKEMLWDMLTMLSSTILKLTIIDPLNISNSKSIGEGWPPLDGSYGIKLVDYEQFEFETIEIIEV